MHKILVIEDEEYVRLNILKLLQFEDFHVIGAENGYVGTQLAKEEIPDLILCDIMMPELDGYGVRKILSQDPVTATIPFIFVTAKTDQADFRLGMLSGADDYLTKPFTRNDLLNAVEARLDKRKVINTQFQHKLDKLCGSINDSLPYELMIPLHAIQEVLQTLITEYDSIERRKILEITTEAYASSLRLQRLSQNFLFYALIETTATDPEQVEILRSKSSSLVKSLITDIANEKAKELKRGADLHLDLQEAKVSISEANLAKIVEELTDNACKFSSPGTPIVIKSVFNGNRFTLFVTDQGQGMTIEQIANLGAYVQFERKLYGQTGSGLGLTIAKRLSQLHGGELAIDSIPYQKTTVRVVLPM